MHLKLGLYEARNNEVATAASLFRFTVKRPKQQGFSLIELMIVVAIIGILAAIAIPAYSAYRENAFNTTALHDLHNVMVAEEAEFASNHAYKSIASGIGPAWIFGGTKFVSKDVGYIINIDAGKQQFAAFSGHAQGSNVYAGDFNGTHEIRTSATPDADAQTQIVSILSGWGSPL